MYLLYEENAKYSTVFLLKFRKIREKRKVEKKENFKNQRTVPGADRFFLRGPDKLRILKTGNFTRRYGDECDKFSGRQLRPLL